jgi:hypothetical protein
MPRPRSRDIVLIEVAALILAMMSASGVVPLSDDSVETALVIMGATLSVSVLHRTNWRRLLPSMMGAMVLFALASFAMAAGMPKVVPAALIGAAMLGIAWSNPETRRAWAERRWWRLPPADSPQV